MGLPILLFAQTLTSKERSLLFVMEWGRLQDLEVIFLLVVDFCCSDLSFMNLYFLLNCLEIIIFPMFQGQYRTDQFSRTLLIKILKKYLFFGKNHCVAKSMMNLREVSEST